MAVSVPLAPRFNAITGLDPVADFDDGTVSSDIVNASMAKAVHFIVHQGVGATGTRTYTVEACDDVSASNVSAVPFWYQQCLATGTSDVMAAAPVLKTTTGVLTTAGSGQIHVISVDADVLAHVGYKFVRLKMVEGTNSPVLAGILVLVESQVPRAIPATQIA